MSNLSIKSTGLGKEYIIGGVEEQYDNFREMLTGAINSPLRKFKKLSGDATEDNRFWALQDINFEINQGDIVGVVGHNGAGKSTLLKILTRITTPTKGRVEIHGRVASLLEVGTGFHPELTGRENIYLNGAILGMERAQINNKFDEIIDFAGVEKFLDTPVKRYSSGMYVRLAFSVAAHLDTDVLLVDEVLAVGDQKFQEKCLGKLGDVSSKGRTVIFVSHNLSAVSTLCKRGILLDKGRIVIDDSIDRVLIKYEDQSTLNRQIANDLSNGEQHITLRRVYFENDDPATESVFETFQECRINFQIESLDNINQAAIEVGVYDEREQRLALISSEFGSKKINLKKGSNSISLSVSSLPLINGRYYLNVAVINNNELVHISQRAIYFSMKNSSQYIVQGKKYGFIALDYDWTTS